MKYLFILITTVILHLSVVGQEVLVSRDIFIADNLMYIKLRINGSRDLMFMLDTGAGVTVVNEKLREELDLQITDKSTIGTAGRSVETLSSAHNKIEIGALILEDITLELMNLDHLSQYFKFEIDGIIGYDFFRDHIVEVDVRNKRMVVHAPSSYTPDPNARKIKIEQLHANHFGIEIELIPNKKDSLKSLLFKVDSGYNGYLVVHNNAISQHDISSERKLKPKKGFGVDSTITENLSGKIFQARIAGETLKNVPAIFVFDPVNVNSYKDKNEYGLIGQEILGKFIITYHLADSCMYMVPE